MTFRKAIAWLLALAMILIQPASVFADTALRAPCSHRWSEWDPIESPTCTSPGLQVRFCSLCFEQQTGTIPALGHSWNAWTVTKEPTCTSTGTQFRTCTLCSEQQTETIPVRGHSWDEGTIIKQPTCTSTGSLVHTCTVCGTRETETMDRAPHKYGKWVDIIPATCTSKGSHYRVCEICGYQQTLDSDPLPHAWSEWVTTKSANCTERGEEVRTCASCGTTEKRTTKVNGTLHEWGDWIIRMEPTCEKGGYRSHGCTKCNKWESEKTPPLGHDWGEWTVITPAAPGVPGMRQHQCTRCRATEKEAYDYVEEPAAEGSLSLKISTGHYSVYKSVSDTVDSTSSVLSGTQNTMSADADLKSAENLWSGLDLAKITIPASLTVTNGMSHTLEVLVSSDHLEDQIGKGSQQQISLPAGSLDQIDYTINVTPDELKTGKLERVVTASSDDGSVSDTKHLSMALYSGGWKPETEDPALMVSAISILPAWNDTLKTSQYRISVCVRNVGNMTLSLDVKSVELNNTTVLTDTFEGWAEAANKTAFMPGDDLYFTYIINETENDRVHDFVHRTLKVGGSVTASGGYVADSISFSFPIDHDPTLDLAVENYHRLDDPGQTIVVDLSLNNRSEIPLTNVQLSSLDLYGKEPLADSFSPKSLAYLMPLFKTYGLLYTICPTQEEIDKGEVIRSVTASAGPDGITDTVYLHYLLNSEKVESEILHLEGKMMSYPLLGLEDLFEADITATNTGNVNLEDIVIQLVVQSADGSVLLNSTYGSSGQGMVYGPGKGVQCFPKISISKQMLVAGLSAKCLNSSCKAKTLTFTFTGLYTRRHSDSQIVPGVSNSVSFTVNLKEGTGGISVRPDLSIPVQTPKAGEKLYVPLIIENIGKEDLVGLQLDVSKAAMNTFVYAATLIYKPFDIIHPGETRPYTFAYTVTEEDVEKGNAGFLFTASSGSSTSTMLYVDSVEYNKALSKEPEKKLLLTKSVTNTPPGGQAAFRLGNEIHYLITITNNTGEDLNNVRVYDDITGYASPVLVSITSLKAGETRSIPFTHVVCPLDVVQLQVENQAYANYTLSTDPMPPTAYSNYVNTPVEETPEEREIVVIEKKLNNTSLDPKGYALGETIDYLITVKSQHKESVVVDVWDDVWGTEAPEMIASITLHPGETRSFNHSYQVREVDLPPTPDLIGSVINEAYASVLIYDDGATIISGYTSWAPPVEAPTIRMVPVENEDQPTPEAPSATPAPKAGPADSCRRILTGYGSCGAEYDLIFCMKHNTLETIARNLPVEEAVTLWEEAVSTGYDSLSGKVSPETTALLRIEQTLFAQQLDSWHTMIAGQFGTEKADAFRMQQLRERCLDLCYAIHHAPAQRTDSILQSGIPVLSVRGERASLCGKSIEAIPGGYHITETVCRTHDFITSSLKQKLAEAASAEEKADAFDNSRQLWMSILMKNASELYPGMTPENQASLSAGLNLFQGWLNARMNVLRALYPGDPAAASEVLAETVHSRMLDLEMLMHD